MRVALLHPTYWPEVRRGSERFARELASGLLAHGHQPRLVTSHPGPTTRVVEDGLPVTRHRRPPRGRLLRRGFEPWLTHLPATWLDLRRGDDHVAHALYPTDGVAALRAGRPLVLSAMGMADRAWVAGARWRPELVTEAMRGAGAVVALSAAARDALWRWLGVEARVIAPGVDLAAFSPDPGARAEHPTILCAADARAPRKRVGLLVEAFARVRRERPTARLVLSAPAPFSAPGIEVRTLDEPHVLARANREAWVSALPSTGEAFGLVLLEALACGTPVVAARDGALPEVVGGDDVGRLFAGEDPAALARALLEALELAGNPATAAACRSYAGRFTWEATTKAYLTVYEEVIR